MSFELSSTQRETLTMARDHGNQLKRRQGGFWTWTDCPYRSTEGFLAGMPVWYCNTQTVRALVKRGFLFYNGNPYSVGITPAGLEALAKTVNVEPTITQPA